MSVIIYLNWLILPYYPNSHIIKDKNELIIKKPNSKFFAIIPEDVCMKNLSKYLDYDANIYVYNTLCIFIDVIGTVEHAKSDEIICTQQNFVISFLKDQ